MIRSNSGYAELDRVFRTRHGDVEGLWTVSRCDPNNLIEFILSSRFRVMSYRFTLIQEKDAGTRIEIERTATASSAECEKYVENARFDLHMGILEVMLNHYLETGKLISNEGAIRRARG